MTGNARIWHLVAVLGIVSLPLLIMYLYQVIDSITAPNPGSLVPGALSFEHWRFLWETVDSGRSSVWAATLNTLIFATVTSAGVVALSLTGGYALSRLNLPARPIFLGGLLVMHSFPTITLIIAILSCCSSLASTTRWPGSSW